MGVIKKAPSGAFFNAKCKVQNDSFRHGFAVPPSSKRKATKAPSQRELADRRSD